MSLMMAAVFTAIIELAFPLSFIVLIDRVLTTGASTTLTTILVALGLFIGLSSGLSYIASRVRAQLDAKLGYELSVNLTRHFFSLRPDEFKASNEAAVISALSATSTVQQVLSNLVLVTWVDALFLCICLAIVWWISPALAALLLIRALAMLVASAVEGKRATERTTNELQIRRHTNQQIIEAAAGLEALATRNATRHMTVPIFEQLSRLKAIQEEGLSGRGGPDRVGSGLDRFFLTVILGMSAAFVLSGAISLGQMLAVYLIARVLTQPLMRLGRCVYDFGRMSRSLTEINAVLQHEPETTAHYDASPLDISGGIEFANVDCVYPDQDRPAIRDVSFQLLPGMHLSIVGPSGSGKSTILKLILATASPTRGKIYIDHRDQREFNSRSLRSSIGYVPQNAHIFRGDLYVNIGLRDPSIGGEAVIAAAKLACAHDFIVALPHGYSTILSPNSLSGGERQRIALARALVHNPKILLFDEHTSFLDFETERKVLSSLAAFSEGRTTVTVTHRLSSIASSDMVIALDCGSIAKAGSKEIFQDVVEGWRSR